MSSNHDILTAKLIYSPNTTDVSNSTSSEPITIDLISKGNEITDEYMKNEFQEDTSAGCANDLIKNIISMQQLTNVTLTEFVNKEKLEKSLNTPPPPQPSTNQTKSKKQQNKEKYQQQQQQQQNNKRIDNESENDEKIVKQPKLE